MEPNRSPNSLTVDTLCEVVRRCLTDTVAKHRDGKAFVTPNLDIVGVPGDDVMRSVMAAAKNKLTITVMAIGQEKADAIPDEATDGSMVYEPVIDRTVKPVESPLVPAEVAGQVAALEELGRKFAAWRHQFVPDVVDSGMGISPQTQPQALDPADYWRDSNDGG